MLKIAVFVSGRGSNLKAIQNSLINQKNCAEIRAVVSNKLNCEAFDFADEQKICIYSVNNEGKNGYLNYDELLQVFEDLEINFIVLAGFLKKIPNKLVKKFPYKIINIHPALLPKFGGKGMYGINVHRAVFESGEKYSGATVHFVDEVYDNGLIIEQKKVEITNTESPEEIAEKVLEIEHELLPSVIKKFACNRIKIVKNKIIIDEGK